METAAEEEDDATVAAWRERVMEEVPPQEQEGAGPVRLSARQRLNATVVPPEVRNLPNPPHPLPSL